MKVGDKVRIVTNLYPYLYPIGTIGFITKELADGHFEVKNEKSGLGRDFIFSPNEIQVIPSIADIWGEP